MVSAFCLQDKNYKVLQTTINADIQEILILSGWSSLTEQKRPRLAVPPAGRILYSLGEECLLLCWLLRGEQKIPGLSQKKTTKQNKTKQIERTDSGLVWVPLQVVSLANQPYLCPDKFFILLMFVAIKNQFGRLVANSEMSHIGDICCQGNHIPSQNPLPTLTCKQVTSQP